jgi:hypothetical protein
MANPYYAGFSSINEEPRDPFGGAIKQTRSNSKMNTSQYSGKQSQKTASSSKGFGPKNQEEALKMLNQMMDKRTMQRK